MATLRDKLIKKQASKPGLRGKINAKCIECLFDPYSVGKGGWRLEIEACTAGDCPLYSVRPTSKRG